MKPFAYPGTQFIGRFQNGKVVGHFWLGLINNGYIHGFANEDGLATGNEIAFIYPDGETALRGHFDNKYMKSAKHVDVLSYACDDHGMFVASEFTKPLSDYEFHYDPPTNASFGGGSLEVGDPFELKNAVIKQSSVPNSGKGIFAIRDLPENVPACYFSLYLYNLNGQYQTHTGTKT